MTNDFRFSAGGFVPELSQKARKEIANRFPRLPIDRIANEASWYVVGRDGAKDRHPSPEKARETLQGLQRQARALHDACCGESVLPLRSLINHHAGLVRLPRIGLDDVREILGNFVLVLAKAEADIPKGHRRTERERLVRTLAAILQDAGEVLDAKPKGTLCQVVEIVLQDVGEEPSDVRKIVRPVVLALEKTTAQAAIFSKDGCCAGRRYVQIVLP